MRQNQEDPALLRSTKIDLLSSKQNKTQQVKKESKVQNFEKKNFDGVF